MVLLDRPAAPKEGDEEDDAADDDEEDGGVEELVAEEVEVLGVGTLDHSPHHYQQKARKLRIETYTIELKIATADILIHLDLLTHRKKKVEEEEAVLDAFDARLHDEST